MRRVAKHSTGGIDRRLRAARWSCGGNYQEVRMNKAWVLALGLSTALVALPAAAQFYVGAGVGQSKAKDFCGGGGGFDSCDDKDKAWKVYGGYAFSPYFAAEIGYNDLGRVKGNPPPVTHRGEKRAGGG